jgi:hypothetical protein
VAQLRGGVGPDGEVYLHAGDLVGQLLDTAPRHPDAEAQRFIRALAAALTKHAAGIGERGRKISAGPAYGTTLWTPEQARQAGLA